MSLDGQIQLLVGRIRTEFNNLRGDRRVDVVAVADVAQTGIQAVDGVAGADGLRVLCVNQQPTHGAQAANGVWVMHAGAWTRDPRFSTAGKIAGAEVVVQQGTNYKGTKWQTNWSATDTLETTYMTWYATVVEQGNAFQYPTPAGPGHLFSDVNVQQLVAWNPGVGWIGQNGSIIATLAYRLGIYWAIPQGTRLYETDTANDWIYVQGTGWVRVSTPAGEFGEFGNTTLPTGWLLCDGSAVSRTTYADLFAAIGTTYGAGNGTTTFNLPNASNAFLRGNTPGVGGGADTHSHTDGTLVAASHSHTSAAHAHTNGDHTHGMSVSNSGGSGSIQRVIAANTAGSNTTPATSSTTPGATGAAAPAVTGTTDSASNIPVYVGVKVGIKI